MGMRQKLVDQVKNRHSATPDHVESAGSGRRLIPTGSTILNLCLSDRDEGGFPTGKIVNLVGDSSSGKTIVALSVFAEMSQDPAFDEYEFVYDDVEAANEFPMETLFGKKAAERIRGPGKDGDEPSDTVQQFRANIVRLIREGRPFVYVLDSLDALTCDEERDKVDANMDAMESGRKVAGTYGVDKPKLLTQILRLIVRDISRTDSLVIIVSQTRDNLNPMSMEKKTRSGGRALKFYSTYEIWTAVGQKIKRKDRVVGMQCLFKVKKNKVTGKYREGTFPIYYSYGVDDISSCADFLVEAKVWKESRQIEAPPFGTFKTRQALLNAVEEEGWEKALRKLVAKEWLRIEESIKMERKPKYA